MEMETLGMKLEQAQTLVDRLASGGLFNTPHDVIQSMSTIKNDVQNRFTQLSNRLDNLSKKTKSIKYSVYIGKVSEIAAENDRFRRKIREHIVTVDSLIGTLQRRLGLDSQPSTGLLFGNQAPSGFGSGTTSLFGANDNQPAQSGGLFGNWHPS